jgi:holliday junction DNA helicase RuvA
VIARLTGTVLERTATAVVLDVRGVGYLVHVTPGADIPPRGQQVTLHTSLQVREDAMTLYGFTSAAELGLFELLLTSSGVGPRLALAALGTHRPDVLRTAIAADDQATLTAIPGVGRKVAQRLVLELKDKVGVVAVVAGDAGAATPATLPAGAAEEARDALVALGYSASEVAGALAAVGQDATEDSAELLRAALRHLGTARTGQP